MKQLIIALLICSMVGCKGKENREFRLPDSVIVDSKDTLSTLGGPVCTYRPIDSPFSIALGDGDTMNNYDDSAVIDATIKKYDTMHIKGNMWDSIDAYGGGETTLWIGDTTVIKDTLLKPLK